MTSHVRGGDGSGGEARNVAATQPPVPAPVPLTVEQGRAPTPAPPPGWSAEQEPDEAGVG